MDALTILDRMTDGYYAVDRDWRITDLNRQAESDFAIPKVDLVGRVLWEILPAEREPTFELETRRAMTDRRAVQFEARSPVSGRWVDVRAYPEREGLAIFFRDLTERQVAEVRAELAAIVESSDDAIISKDVNGIVRSWNKGAERILGYTADEMVGKPISVISPADRRGEMNRILQSILRDERVDHFETKRVRKDGRVIEVSLTVSPVKDAQGCITGASKILRDVTERKEAEQEREILLESERAARSEVERASRVKDEFLATLSHELRTPLAAIVGWAHLLRGGTLDGEDHSKGLEVIERNARVQTQIIEDLLDMSRILSGKVRLDVQRIDLPPVIDAALETVGPAAETKSIRIQSVLDPFVGPVMGDPNRLQQVIWNLLSNAVKFTPKDGRVQVTLERVNSHLEISVSDTGQGIKPDFLPHVFERFRQADSSASRRHGGLGIGLSIVKQLVELHGGSIYAKSPGEGQGSTFIVRLPLASVRVQKDEERIHPRVPQHAPLDIAVPTLSGLRILVVDDESDARDLIRRVLEDSGADVITAGSVPEALELLRCERPNILVSDIGMPDQDGYDLIRQIRKLVPEQGGQVPALALTAFARSEDRTRALLLGYGMHVAKPVEPTELVAGIAALARRGN